MSKDDSNKKGRTQEATSTVRKGRILERIAALMHEQPGVTVRCNQFLFPLNGKGRKREIDILLTCTVAGYPVQMAIECKNENTPIGAPKIDGFIGKLQYVGIPPQYGFFISASGYTTSAIERATAAGMRTLTLRGLTEESLFRSITDAFQSVIYLLPQVIELRVTNEAPPDGHEAEVLGFYNNEGRLAALLPDFIWHTWLTDTMPINIGEHELDIPLPQGLYQKVHGRTVEVYSLGAKIRILGLVLTLEGTMREYQLVNATNEAVEKGLVDVSFGQPEAKLPVKAFTSEDQLQAFLFKPGTAQLTVGRLKLPRIQNGAIYWPPSERIAKIMRERWQDFESGKISDPRLYNFQEFEGTDLQTLWEPIWEGHPAGHKTVENDEG